MISVSSETLKVLKNFSKINSGIVFDGHMLRVLSPTETVVGITRIAEDLPSGKGIYDMSRFLSVISMFESPTFEFLDHIVRIQEAGNPKKKTEYVLSNPSQIVTLEDDEVPLNPLFSIHLSGSDFENLIQMSSILKLPHLVIIGNSNGTFIQVQDIKNPTGDIHSIKVSDENKYTNDFSLVLKVEYIRDFFPSDYTIKVEFEVGDDGDINDGSCEFQESNYNIRYWVCSEVTGSKVTL